MEQEKDREKEKVGGSPARLNEKKSDRDLKREIKNKGLFSWNNNMIVRNASGQQCKVKISGSEKK